MAFEALQLNPLEENSGEKTKKGQNNKLVPFPAKKKEVEAPKRYFAPRNKTEEFYDLMARERVRRGLNYTPASEKIGREEVEEFHSQEKSIQVSELETEQKEKENNKKQEAA